MAERTGVESAPNRVWASWNIGEKYGNGMSFFVGGADFAEFMRNLVEVGGTSLGDQFLGEWNTHISDTLPNRDAKPTPDEAIRNLRSGGLVGNEPVHGEARKCKHGDMTYREGKSAKGPWSAWFCPLPKGHAEQCKPVFL